MWNSEARQRVAAVSIALSGVPILLTLQNSTLNAHHLSCIIMAVALLCAK
jgi:hypothetical protein